MLEVIMFSSIQRWYNGESKILDFENEYDSSTIIMPFIYTEYHWSAKIARAIVSFYLRHWQWIWSTIMTGIGLYVAIIALK